MLCLPRNLHMEVHEALCLPRNLHIQRRCPADARAYIRPLGKQQSAVPATRSAHGGSQSTAPATKSAHEGSQSAAPATKSAHPAPAPSRRQGVHPTPWQAAKCCACHEICTRRFTKYCLRLPRNLHMKVHKVLRLPRNLHIKRRCPADARAYIRPLGKQQSAVPATRSAHGGSQSTAPATKSAHEGSQRAAPATKSAHPAPVPSRRQGVHPTPWQAAKCCACHEICTRRFTKYCACHEICTSSAGAQPTPGRTSDPLASSKALCLPRDLHTEVHKVLRLPRNPHMKVHNVLRLPRNLRIQRRCPADARAYIRPLGKQQSAVPATRSAHGGSQSTAPATKPAHEGSQSAAPATKSAHQAPVPSRRQGVHPTPWQAAKCCACHEICTRRFTKYCACHKICT